MAGLGRFLPAVLGGDLSARPNLASHGYTINPKGEVIFPNMDLGGAGLSFHNPGAYEVSGAGDVAMPPPVSFQPRDADLSLRNLGQFVGPSADAMDAIDVIEGIRDRDPARAGLGMVGLGLPMLGGLGGMVKAYHGSPHAFDAFDARKIGTGEGAQAYGHGLYFAENPKVAGQYAEGVKDMAQIEELNKEMTQLSREMSKYEISYRNYRDPRGDELAKEYDEVMAKRDALVSDKGKVYDVELDVEPEDLLDLELPLSKQPPKVKKALNARGINTEPPLTKYRIMDAGGGDDVFDILDENRGRYLTGSWNTREEAQSFIDTQHADESRIWTKNNNGMTAMMELGEGLEKEPLRRWRDLTGFDNPLREDLALEYFPQFADEIKEIYSTPMLNPKEAAADYLQKAGVPGLRYLDASSRSAKEGTRNVVMFPGTEGKIKITGRK